MASINKDALGKIRQEHSKAKDETAILDLSNKVDILPKKNESLTQDYDLSKYGNQFSPAEQQVKKTILKNKPIHKKNYVK